SSSPSNRAEPVTRPLAAIRPITAMKVWLLPEPLSPTTPRHSPGRTSSDTPRTAGTSPSGVSKVTDRSRISRTAGSAMTRLLLAPGTLMAAAAAGKEPASGLDVVAGRDRKGGPLAKPAHRFFSRHAQGMVRVAAATPVVRTADPAANADAH